MLPFPDLTPDFGRSVWTVSSLTAYIRELFELDYRLQDVEVTGEISNFSRAASGHLYFTLKDSGAQLKCVMWRSQAERLRIRPVEGDAVVVRGRISVYEANGVYQLYAERLESTGRGDLAAAFERLKSALATEGLYDAEHKKPIPVLPRKIGIVTSSGAAALRDILTVLQRRYPFVSVLIAPTLVQGEQAPAQIIRALQWLDGRNDIDTIIVARGGGSIEDLWAFNDERVARAVFAARHPIISGVGHETDFTITDFVADLRAPTPSAAAELSVPDMSNIAPVIWDWKLTMNAAIEERIEVRRDATRSKRQVLRLLSPRRKIDSGRQLVDGFGFRLARGWLKQRDKRASRLAVVEAHLAAVNPLATLARGFAIVRDQSGQIIRSIHQAVPGEELSIRVQDGTFGAQVGNHGEVA